MKNYFSFKLSGGKVFPYFILIWVAVSVAMTLNMTLFKPVPGMANLTAAIGNFVVMICMILVELLCMFGIYKLAVNALSYKNISIKFDQNFDSYLLMVFKGFLLSIVTLGIYYPWFVKNYIDFFADNSTYDEKKIEFKGSGAILFVIIFCTMVVYILSIVGFGMFAALQQPILAVISIIVCILSLCAMVYLFYRWCINFKFDNKYLIVLNDGEHASSVLFIAGQVLLSIITIGLYIPAADIQIFKYFAQRVRAKDETGVVKEVGCDLNLSNDFFYVFGQYLLILITLGIYTPWGLCFIYQRYLSKTYISD